MAAPRFHFVEMSLPAADPQFWRDVEASERLGSRFKANLYLRDLCHTKAWADGRAAGTGDHFAREEHERALVHEVAARGFRLFGEDVAATGNPAGLARAS